MPHEPLKAAWQGMLKDMEGDAFTANEIEIAHAAFLRGVKVAIDEGLSGPVGLVLLRKEMREMAKETLWQMLKP